MRRARIKAVATVPVRRKATQDSTQVVPPVQCDAKEPEKLPDNNEQFNNESVKVDTQEEAVKIVDVPQSAKNSPVPFVKEKDQSEDVSKLPQNIPVSQSPHKSLVSFVKEKDQSEDISKSPQKIPVSPVRKECLGVNVEDIDKEVDLQPSKKSDSLQKSSIEVPLKTIQNRSHFMRPTPRLDGSGRIRRNSIQGSGASASESEDDSRRSSSVIPNRVRNDSICSTFSIKDTGNVGNISKLNLGQKRRMVVSESARKLAEARREFLLKHEKQPPDKSKLTMYDLIYYNPVTNPMTPKSTANRPAVRKNSICSLSDKKEEEIIDEPAEMLVPQVKVGPNGQLIIDEQSLVIDQYKAQENINRSDILVDEETNSGFYKRRNKSKDWSKWETLKFYKALNTYGTDFLLMQSVFPKRTRQELKLKYKKEEKMNHNLVEKALVYQEFDTEALEKDLAKVEENERLESESNKKVKKKDKDKKRKRARCLKLVEEVNCEDDQNSDANKNSGEGLTSDEEKIEKPGPKKGRITRKRKAIVADPNSSNESLINDSDSSPELYEVQTTRSGRTSRKIKKLTKPKQIPSNETKGKSKNVTKMNDKQNNNEKEIILDIKVGNPYCNEGNDSKVAENKHTIDVPNVGILNNSENAETLTTDINISMVPSGFSDISNFETLVPGSLVVLAKDSIEESGKQIIEQYMVSPNYNSDDPCSKDNFISVTLTPDLMKTVTNVIQINKPENNS